jgi:WD40 repeat protein
VKQLITVFSVFLTAALLGAAEPPSPKPSATDSLGDPLPEGARLRLGTWRFRAPSTVSDMALSPDEKTVVTVGKQLIAWNAITGEQRWQADSDDFGLDQMSAAYGSRSLAFCSDGAQFFTPGRKNEVVVWNTLTGHHKVLPIESANQHPGERCRAIDVSPNRELIAVGSAQGAVVCDQESEILYAIENHPAGPLDLNNHKDRLKFGGHYSLVRFSPDGKTLAVVTSDQPDAIRLLEAKAGQELRRIALKSQLVRLAFSADCKQVATTERDNAVRLYDVESGQQLWSYVAQLTNPYENYTSAVAFSPDGKTIAACATDFSIYLLDAETGKLNAKLTGHTWYPWALAFTADGKMLYSSGWDGSVRRWDLATQTQLALPKGRRATGIIAASPDGRTLAYADDSGSIRIVDAEGGTERQTLELSGTRYSRLTFSSDGRQLAGGGTCGDSVHVAVWNLPGGTVAHRCDWPKGRDPHSTIESICFNARGNRLAAAVFRQSAAYVWDLTNGQRTAQLEHDHICGLSFSPDGETLATAGGDSIVRFWTPDTGAIRSELDVRTDPAEGGDPRMYAVRYAPQGGLIATAHLDGKVRIWQADNLALRKTFALTGRFSSGAIGFSPDGLWLATGSMAGQVTLWDPFTGERVLDVGQHQGYVCTVGFGRDNRTIVTGGADGVCYRWDLRPPGKQADNDLNRLWNDLAGDDSAAAYRAMWALAETPEGSVTFLADKLRPIKSLIDPDQLNDGSTDEETQRREILKKRLLDKDKEVERWVTVARAVSLLGQLGTLEAFRILKDLSSQEPTGDVAPLATDALDRFGTREQR